MLTSLRSHKLERIHLWQIAYVWPSVQDGIAEALRRSRSDYTTEHVFNKLKTGFSTLWIITCNGGIVAAGTTEFARLKNGRTLCVVSTLTGEDMATWDHTWEQFEQYARDQKCDGIQVVGRIGWVRYLRHRGFKQPWVVLEKSL